jgi:hypothetical protein
MLILPYLCTKWKEETKKEQCKCTKWKEEKKRYVNQFYVVTILGRKHAINAFCSATSLLNRKTWKKTRTACDRWLIQNSSSARTRPLVKSFRIYLVPIAPKTKAIILILLMQEAASTELIIIERSHSFRQITADKKRHGYVQAQFLKTITKGHV